MVLVNAQKDAKETTLELFFEPRFSVGDYRTYQNYHPSDQAKKGMKISLDLSISRYEPLRLFTITLAHCTMLIIKRIHLQPRQCSK